MNRDDKTTLNPPGLHKTEMPMLKKLHLQRNHAFQAMNDEVEDIVNQCLEAKSRLQAVEDSNRNLQQEIRSLRGKYEALLEKNKKDSGIIINLKDAESTLQKAFETREEAEESLVQVQLSNKQKSLERRLLQDERAKLLLKSQTVSNSFGKINLKHQRIQEKIERQKKISEDDRHQHEQEMKELKARLADDRALLDKWVKTNTERDDEIRSLQEDMKNGWKVEEQAIVENSVFQEDADPSRSDHSEKTDKGELEKKTPGKEGKVDLESEKNHNPQKEAIRHEWARKKTLFEVAEKSRDHLMDMYMQLNKKHQDLSVEVMCAREWRIDKEAEKKELVERTARLEQLVAQKRRQRAVPTRTANEELAIWIKTQQETNLVLRDVLSKCLSIKRDEFKSYSEFAKAVKETYRDALKAEQPSESGGSERNSSELETEATDKV